MKQEDLEYATGLKLHAYYHLVDLLEAAGTRHSSNLNILTVVLLYRMKMRHGFHYRGLKLFFNIGLELAFKQFWEPVFRHYNLDNYIPKVNLN